MKIILNFIKTTLIGGLLIVLPAWFTVLLLAKVINGAITFLKPLANMMPQNIVHVNAMSFIILVVICLITGLLAKTNLVKKTGRIIERYTLELVPGYMLLRGMVAQSFGKGEKLPFQPAFAEIEDALVPAFIVEEHSDGRYTVFVSSSPTPMVGTIYILSADRVHLADISLAKAMGCIAKWGAGSEEMIKSMRLK